VLLEEALSGNAVGAAQQGEHAAGDVPAHMVPDLLVVLGEHCLGDACVLPIDPVGMGQLHACDGIDCRFGGRLGGFLLRLLAERGLFRPDRLRRLVGFAHHLRGRLVLAHALV
jgi:hypothetical protein